MEFSTDIYYPQSIHTTNELDCITILILQGVEVDKSEYQSLASLLAEKGFRVIVPNFSQSNNYVCSDSNSVAHFLQTQEALNPRFQESLKDKFVLLGHSAGGIAAFQSLSTNSPALEIPPFAIITYGSSIPKLLELQYHCPCNLIISGLQDSIVAPHITESQLQNLPSGKNFFLKLADFDHYSITNSGTPQKYINEITKPSLYGFSATDILAHVISEFILGYLNDSPWHENIDLDTIIELQKT